jgi:transposase
MPAWRDNRTLRAELIRFSGKISQMKSAAEPLPSDPRQLRDMVLSLQAELAEAHQDYQQLLEQFRLAQQHRFGKSSEASPDQLGLFNEAEAEAGEERSEPGRECITYTRNKPKRKPLPKDLPREQVIHDLEESDKICDDCGHDLHRMGEETSEQLEFIPAQLKVIEHIRPKYACRHCETAGTRSAIKIAPMPPMPIPKSIATPSLLSQIITSKYQYALPLYRQESLFKQAGIGLSRKTQAEWMIKSSALLDVMYQRLKTIQLEQTVIQADETSLNVLHEDKTTCYMWVYCTGSDSPPDQPDEGHPPNIVLYDYQPSRAGQCAVDYLNGYRGYLQVDGYAGYEQTKAQLVGCFAHARRKFIEAQKVQPKGKTGKADWAINHIQKLYAIESRLKSKPVEEKPLIRQQQAGPVIDQLKDWLDKSALQLPPKTAIGKAIAYSLNQWPKLVRYIEHGALAIDNNRAERAIKPFVIGRKNWLFSNTANGARASAILYSLVETAKANGLMPFDYLKTLLEELPRQDGNIDHLLPWQMKIQ